MQRTITIDFKHFLSFSACLLFATAFTQENATVIVKKANSLYNTYPDSALNLCLEAEKIAQPNELGEICICKIRSYILFTDYEQAMIEIQRAIRFFTAQKDDANLSYIYMLKSNLLNRIGESEEAQKTILKAYHISKRLGDTSGMISKLLNITHHLISSNNQLEAKKYLLILERYSGRLSNYNRYYYHQNYGQYYISAGEYPQAIVHLLQAKKLAYQERMTDSQATICVILARAYLNDNQVDLARQYANESLNFSRSHKLIHETAEALEELMLIAESEKKYAEAYVFQKQLYAVKDSIFNIEKLNNVRAVTQRLELAKKEKEIISKNLEVEKLKVAGLAADEKNKWLYRILIFGALFSTLLVYVYLKTRKLNKIIHKQKIIVENKNKEILDSITYARRIQSAILPQHKILGQHFNDFFIYYQPKDIVAGDFYWFEIIDDLIFLAVADCTGHGVPGAMVSVVCNNALNRSIKEFNLKSANDILDNTRKIIISEFEKSDEEVKDGMDISLFVLDKKTNQISWSGAHNPLWIVRNGEIIDFKADKQPVGKFAFAHAFTNHEIQLQNDDCIYVFSDGYSDQFGGPKGKKFRSAQMKQLFLEINSKSMADQQANLKSNFIKWKGKEEQVDDVCVLGIRY